MKHKLINYIETLFRKRRLCVYYGENRILCGTSDHRILFLNTDDLVMTPAILKYGHWEQAITRVLKESLQPGMTFVDVGANIGYHACFAARYILPGGALYCYEPDTVSYRLLHDNLSINKTRRELGGELYVSSKGIGRETGTATFYRRNRYASNSTLMPLNVEFIQSIEDDAELYEIEVTTLDAEFAQQDKPVHMIKIDVEGTEEAVLAGMRETLRANPGMKILLEWSGRMINRTEGMLDFFQDYFREYSLRPYLLEEKRELSLDELELLDYGNLLLRR